MDKTSKIEALKNVNLNPYRLNSPYDGLSNSLNRWKTVAQSASSMSPEDKEKVASNYYDKMIGPMYGGMQITPMDKSLWMKSAYNEALKYNVEDSYDWSVTHGMKRGYDSASAAIGRTGQLLTNVLGYAIKTNISDIKQTYKTIVGDQSWHQTVQNLHNEVSQEGFFENAEKATSKIPILNKISSISKHGTEGLDFWGQALPNQDWTSKATSFVTEQAMQLPLYMAMGAGNKLVTGSNLTKNLLASPIGKKVFGLLMAGTEGLAYGVATRPQEDKNQTWRDAVGFAIFHGLFEAGGIGVKKLIDLAPPGSSELERLKARQDSLDLAQEGKRRATGVEVYEDHKKEVANNLAAGGIPAQRSIYADALRHVENMQNVEHGNWTKDQVKDYELGLMKDDPARWGPTLSAAKYIRSLLGDRKLSDLNPDEEHFLSERLSKLIVDAGSEMNKHVDGLKEQIAGDTVKAVEAPSAKHTLDFYIAKASAQIAKQDPTALKMMKPEEVQAVAKKMMAEDAAKAAKIAEQKLSENTEREAKNIAKRRKDVDTAAKKTAPVKFKSSYKEDKYGQPSASFKAEPDYKIRLDNIKKQAKESGKSLEEFFHDMDDSDFNADLSNHFYPKVLKQSEVFFENQNTREGAQNPNFLAFMYNYIDQMPREFGKELEQRLIDTMKVQKYMSGRKPTEPQLMYYAKAMYNHVDNFLGSGRWPKESNIFRSTQDKLWQSTQWQMQLLREKQVQERKNLKDMFSGNPRALRNAMITYRVLAKKRLEQYSIGPKDMSSQEHITDYDDQIASHIEQTGQYERIPF